MCPPVNDDDVGLGEGELLMRCFDRPRVVPPVEVVADSTLVA
jgi:hypothetical protein